VHSLIKRQLGKTIADFFFPPRCIECAKFGSLLCEGCIKKLPWIMPPFCRKCGKPETSGELCSSCWSATISIDGIRSAFRFEGTIRKTIHEFKYYNLKALSNAIAELLFTYLKNNPVPGDFLLPVPLHRRRLHQRGYNQSYLIARELGKLINLPILQKGLIRITDSKPQAQASNVSERLRNVYNAFSCSSTIFSGKRLILIDDVCTTGATLEACTIALKAAGASQVWGLTIAREI
jgi:competence protein ComFC